MESEHAAAGASTPSYLCYWGKADPIVGGYHPAALHCLDVAAVAERLVESDRQLAAKLARWLQVPPETVEATVALFVALHDVGKFDVRFQAKAPDLARSLRSEWRDIDSRTGRGFPHGAGGFGHLLRDHRAFVNDSLGANAWRLLQAVTGHHGELPSRRGSQDIATVSPKLYALARHDREARAAWLVAAHRLFCGRGASLPLAVEPTSPLVVVLAGLCSVADWIGSSVDFFPYGAPADLAAYYEERALPRAAAALDALALRAGRPSGKTFSELFPGFEVRDVQRVTEGLRLDDGPCLVVVEAQMGSGKTEAALSLAERLLERRDASGLYVALPTMATANAMWTRLKHDVPRLFAGTVNLTLAHGRRELNRDFQRLIARGGPAASRYDDEASVMCSRWLLRSKRALLGQVGAGTIDQAMLAVLRVRHHFIRAYALAGSVVLLDEVHAYDAYMQAIIVRLIEWLGAMGAPVLLLSATLPESKRHELVSAYARGSGWAEPARPERSPAHAPYPLVTVLSESGAAEHHLSAAPSSTGVALEICASEAPEELVLGRLAEAARAGAMVAWIRNTVGDAQRAYDAALALSAPGLTLFHARMRGCDRSDVEARVLARFGKQGERGGALLIATQVVEQSLDLDFDWLATDLCPIDLLLQRAGRLHRHRRPDRPRGFERPALLVVSPEPSACDELNFSGSGYVYDRATLGLSLELLLGRRQIDLPGDIRELVEAVYDPAERATRIAGSPNRLALESAEASRLERLDKEHSVAERACVAPSTFDPQAAEAYYDDDDEQIQALTRLGESSTLLPVLWDGEAGYALEGGEAWQLDPGDPAAWKTARRLAEQTVNVPAYPGESIERGARARGEQGAWDAWSARMRDFLQQTGLGDAVVVPMRTGSDDSWRGSVVTTRGRRRRLAYSRNRGLWFRSEDEA
jgi:CRISPR-associated endonuclease/helicase Cas3